MGLVMLPLWVLNLCLAYVHRLLVSNLSFDFVHITATEKPCRRLSGS